jgi:hypothetical protein
LGCCKVYNENVLQGLKIHLKLWLILQVHEVYDAK